MDDSTPYFTSVWSQPPELRYFCCKGQMIIFTLNRFLLILFLINHFLQKSGHIDLADRIANQVKNKQENNLNIFTCMLFLYRKAFDYMKTFRTLLRLDWWPTWDDYELWPALNREYHCWTSFSLVCMTSLTSVMERWKLVCNLLHFPWISNSVLNHEHFFAKMCHI